MIASLLSGWQYVIIVIVICVTLVFIAAIRSQGK